MSIFIQGGTRGIGRGIAERILSERSDAKVFVSGRNASQIADWHHLNLTLVDLDVTDSTTIAGAVGVVQKQTERLHLLLNVSGLLHDPNTRMSPEKKLDDLNFDQLARSFAVNAIGPVMMMKHFLPFFRHTDHAVIANFSARVGSIADNGLGGWYGYRASKAAQNMFTKTAAIELSRKAKSTVVVALHPGTVDTDLSTPFQKHVPPEKLFTVERASLQLLSVINGLTIRDSGGFFDWAGEPIPW